MKNHILFLICIIFLFSFKKNESHTLYNICTSDTNLIFVAKIDAKQWNAISAFYESGNNTLITAISSDFSCLNIHINGFSSGTYNLDSLTTFSNDDGTFYAQSGTITYNESASGFINGTFFIKFVCREDKSKMIEFSEGHFENVPMQNIMNENITSFILSKEMKIDATKGTVVTENSLVDISIQKEKITFAYKKNSKKTFSVSINRIENMGSAIIYYASDANIDYISIDLISNKQTTVWYKNGNTITFF